LYNPVESDAYMGISSDSDWNSAKAEDHEENTGDINILEPRTAVIPDIEPEICGYPTDEITTTPVFNVPVCNSIQLLHTALALLLIITILITAYIGINTNTIVMLIMNTIIVITIFIVSSNLIPVVC